MVGTGMEQALGVAVDKNHVVFAPNYRVLGGMGGITRAGKASLLFRLDELAPIEGDVPYAVGVRLDTQQRLILADASGRVLRIDQQGSQVDVLADRFEGAKLRVVSHVALDRAGNIYFTEHGPDPNARDGRVFAYQIRTQKTALLADRLAAPSGIAVSPDQTTLFVAERATRSIVALKFDDSAADRETLIAFPKQTVDDIVGGEFEPLGMACDKKGRLYVAMGKGEVVNVVEAPTGRLLRQYRTRGEVADCHFDDASLLVALPSKEAIFRLPLGVEGFKYSQ